MSLKIEELQHPPDFYAPHLPEMRKSLSAKRLLPPPGQGVEEKKEEGEEEED